MKKFHLLFPLLFISVFAAAQTYFVGHKSLNFKDASRTGGYAIAGGTTNPAGATGRDIGTEIYYPATATGNNTPVAIGAFPVIVFGHGFSMTWDAYTTLWDSMVRNGYVLCFPRTEGSTIPAPSHTDFGKDLAKVADLMLAGTTPFPGSLNSRVSIGGHSMGGGATFLADQYTNAAKCYFTFAAAETNPKASSAAKAITKPHLIFTGGMDCVAPTATNQTLMYDSLASFCKYHVNILRGYHCAFADNNFLCGFGEGTCITAGGLSSAEQQRRTRLFLEPYLDYYLKGICPAWTKFETLIDTASFINLMGVSCTNTVPTNASITGNNYFCQNSSTTLSANPSGFQYVWSNNLTADTISVNTAGNYSVVVGNGTCALPAVSVSVTENFPPSIPSAIVAADTVCSAISNLAIAVTNDASVTQYNWTLPNGWSITGGSNSNSIVATSGIGGGIISVTAQNNCGTTAAVTKTVTVVPSNLGTPGSVSGNSSVCPGASVSYTIAPVSGANAYTWSWPGDWSVLTLNPDTSVMFTTGDSSGNIMVSAVNSCGQSVPAVIPVTVNPLPELGFIYGTDSVCLSNNGPLNFSLSAVDYADSIVWIVSSPWEITAGQGSSAISVTGNMSSGTVNLYAANQCGTTYAQALAVVYLDTPQVSISLQGNTLHASATIGTSYQWYYGGALISGANNADYSPVASGDYTVSVTNAYGCSTQSAPFNFVYSSINEIASANYILIYPNPGTGSKLQITIGEEWIGAKLRIIDGTGKLMAQYHLLTKSEELDLGLLSTGIYAVQVEKNGNTLRGKLVRQ